MILEKTLIRFYKKSAKLDETRLKLKESKKSSIKFNINDNPDILSIQRAIDIQVEIKTLSDIIAKLPSELTEIQRKTIVMLKAIGIRAKKKISIEHDQYGHINFWYEGSYLYFQKHA